MTLKDDEPMFHEGQRVMVKSHVEFGNLEGSVTGVGKHVLVRLPSFGDVPFNERHLEPLPNEPKFKFGDKVRVNYLGETWHGCIGEVESVYSNSWYVVRFPGNGNYGTYHEARLIPVYKPTTAEVKTFGSGQGKDVTEVTIHIGDQYTVTIRKKG